jgi:hypothetical protein
MKRLLLLSSILVLTLGARAQTVGWFYTYEGAEPGYVLFAPNPSDTTYLIDKCGKKLHTWKSNYPPGLAVYLLDDGTLLRCGSTDNNNFQGGGSGGIIEKFDWDGNVLWSYEISDNTQCQHHDAIQLPNGNILAIAWETRTKTEATAEGRNPSGLGNTIWTDKLVEIQPVGIDSGIIVWEWHAWDHLVQDYDSTKENFGVVADHPELIDINLGTINNFNKDWLHLNSVAYNEEFDQVMVSCHNLSEIWIIDHSTTTEVAASHSGGNSGKGGDLLYRWGNPKNYDRGTSGDQKLYQQHNAYWIPEGMPGEGSVMIFNNGVSRPGGNASSVDVITTPEVVDFNYPIDDTEPYGPVTQDWVYMANPANSFFTQTMGGSQRLPNGNTIICEANSGNFFEVDEAGVELWKYVNPVGQNGITTQGSNPFLNNAFRCTWLSFDHPGLAGQVLTPGPPIEKEPLTYFCENFPTAVAGSLASDQIAAFPNPFHDQFGIYASAELNNVTIRLYDGLGRLVTEEKRVDLLSGSSFEVSPRNQKGLLLLTITAESGYVLWKQSLVAQ